MNNNPNKLLLLILGVLLIANTVLLVLYFQKPTGNRRSHEDRKAAIATFLKKDIGFNDQQIESFSSLSDEHSKKIKAFYDAEKITKEDQFKQLATGNFSDSLRLALAERVASTEQRSTLLLYAHLNSVRSLCTPQQLPAFDSLFGRQLGRRNNGPKEK